MKHPRRLTFLAALLLGTATLAAAQNSLEIIAAYYGNGERFTDVTARIRPLATPDGRLQFLVSPASFRMPSDGGAKRAVRIYYKWNGQFQHNEWPDGETVRIGTAATEPAVPEPSSASRSLRIVKALYGAGRRTLDVTQLLQGLVAADRLEVAVSNATMGGKDPAPAVVKSLTLTYEFQGRTIETLVPENGTLRIPEDPANATAQGLQIVQAIYGTDARNADVTKILQSLVSNDKVSLTVGVNTLAVDPSRGDEKTLFVIFLWEGRRYEARVGDGKLLELPGRGGPGATRPPSLFGTTADGVCLHPGLEFQGTPFCVAAGQNASQLPAFAKYGSAQFRGRIRWVELFELPGFKGRTVRLEASEADLTRFGSGQNPWVVRPGSLKLN